MPRAKPIDHITGIVIRVNPSGDSDLVLHILSAEQGKFAAIAKHSRKPTRNQTRLDLFDEGRFEIRRPGGPLAIIRTFIPNRSFHHLRDSLDRIAAAAMVCEVVDGLIPDEAHDEGENYQAVCQALESIALASGTRDILAALYHALASALTLAGYLDPTELESPSAKRLEGLLSQIEQILERRLISRKEIERSVAKLRKESTAEPRSEI